MNIKFCGFTRLEDVESALQLDFKFMGFIIAKSKRQVSVDFIKDAVRLLPSRINPVLVSQNHSLLELKEIQSETGIQWFQLHGHESPGFCQSVPGKVVKVLEYGPKISLQFSEYSPVADYLLIDSAKVQAAHSGSGGTWNWQEFPTDLDFSRIWVAGGLNPQNIENLVKVMHPNGVDVASGIEKTPGVKDIGKMQDFIKRVKAAL